MNEETTILINVNGTDKYIDQTKQIKDLGFLFGNVYVTDKTGNLATFAYNSTEPLHDGYKYSTTAASYVTVTVKENSLDPGTAKTFAAGSKVSDLGLTGKVYDSNTSAIVADTTALVDGHTYMGDCIAISVNSAPQAVPNGTTVNDLSTSLSLTGKIKVDDNAPVANTDTTVTIADGAVITDKWVDVTFGTTDVDTVFDDTTVAWFINDEEVTASGTLYAQIGDKVVCKVTTGATGFQAGGTPSTMVGNANATAAVEAAYLYATTPPALATTSTTNDTVQFTNGQTYAGGQVSFTWTAATGGLSGLQVTGTNA